MDHLTLFVRAALIENLALSFFLGMCTFLAVSSAWRPRWGWAPRSIVVQTITVPVNNVIHRLSS